MFRPVRMAKVNILLLSKHVTEITRILGQRGLVHLVDAVNQSNDRLLKGVEQERNEKTVYNLLSRCERLMEGLGVDASAVVPPKEGDMALEDMSALVTRIYSRYREQEGAIDRLLKDSGALNKERSVIASFPLQQVSLDALRNLSHFYMVTGRLASSVIPRASMDLGDRAVIVQADGKEGNVLVLSSSKNRWAVKDELSKFGFTEVEAPESISGSAESATRQMDDELANLRNELEECRLNVLKLSEEYGGVLLVMRSQLKGLIAVQQAQKHFGRVAQLYCISGWTPDTEVATVKDIVNETTGGTGVVEVIEAENDALVKAGIENVPVKFTGGALLRPFQMLVSNFGLPRYSELDPTVFVGITFVLLFGFMFGDIGQGLVLALIGLWLRLTKKKLDQSLKDGGILLMSCGICSMVFGFCYGSFFGYENHELLKPLWLSPLNQKDIGKLLLTAVGIGIIFSSVAITINIINHFIAKKYFEGVFDRFGVLGLLFYWFALGTGIWVVKTKTFPIWAGVLIMAPLVLLFLRGPLRHYVFKQKGKHGEEEDESLFNMLLEACIELMETFTGYISGTVSFVRVGAFAISHAALCLAIFSIVNMIHTMNVPGGPVVSAIVIIFGNIMVIAFEGMVAMIQGVRLEYYELFGKYFSGGGVAYSPFQIEDKPSTQETTKKGVKQA